MGAPIELTGMRFGRWLVIDRSHSSGNGIHWNCVCDCGTRRAVNSRLLRLKKSRSCGCLHAEVTSSIFTTHGMSGSPEYSVWEGMKERCFNSACDAYPYYGGRGITVCARWRDNFQMFFDDVGPKPPGASIDRIDNDRGYEPGNVRWAPMSVQNLNRRNNIRIECYGKNQTISEWAEELGINFQTIRNRLARNLKPEEVLSKCRFKSGRKFKWQTELTK